MALQKFCLTIVGRGNHDCARVYFRDAEVTTQMDQIKRAKIARDLDHVHIFGAARQNRQAIDVRPGEVQPEIGEGPVLG